MFRFSACFYTVAVCVSAMSGANPGGDCSKVSTFNRAGQYSWFYIRCIMVPLFRSRRADCFRIIPVPFTMPLSSSHKPTLLQTPKGIMALTTQRSSLIYHSSRASATILMVQLPGKAGNGAQAPSRQAHAEKEAKYILLFQFMAWLPDSYTRLSWSGLS